LDAIYIRSAVIEIIGIGFLAQTKQVKNDKIPVLNELDSAKNG
jgi:hypothetical protein